MNSLDFLRGNGAALLVLATAVFIVIVPSVRLALAGLVVQYALLTMLYLDVMDPRLALVKLLVGWFACLILMITGQQVDWGRAAKQTKSRPVLIGERKIPVTAVRGVLALVMLGIVWLLARQELPFTAALPEPVALAVYGLVGFGLLCLLTSLDELLRAGIGVLMLIVGLELYTATLLEQTPGNLVLMAAVNLAVVLIVSFLTQKRFTTVKLQNQDF